jgi:hypothetical protein
VVLAKGCAICLILLVVSPVTAPFRTLDVIASYAAAPRAALSVPGGSDPASVDEATLTTDPVAAKSIRFLGIVPPAAASGRFAAPLPCAGSPHVGAAGAPARHSHVSPVLRV